MQQPALTIPPRPTRQRADLALGIMAALLVMTLATGSFVVTTPGAMLVGLSLLVTLVVAAFSHRQMRADPSRASFFRLSIGLALGTVMLALAADALLLVAGWTVTGRIMTGLVGHVGTCPQARAAARRASLAFTIGDLALVGAVLILSNGAGSTNLAAIAARVPAMSAGALLAAALLLCLSALARCAILPGSGWLFGSLAAPTPVSALMHAGFVNAGGFLLIRFAPVLEAAPAARVVLFAAGTLAAVVGSAIMMIRSDVKGTLAASTIAQMGFMVLTIALGAYAAALWHMAAHGLFKAWLFLGSAGTVTAATGPAKGLKGPLPALIAGLALGGMVAAAQAGGAYAVLPVGLVLAALLGALAVAAQGQGRGAPVLAVIAVPLLLVALNAAVLAGIGAVQPNAAAPLLPPVAQFALLAFFLAAWVWQQSVLAGERSLHPSLIARLLHAGAPDARVFSSLKD